MNAQSVSHTITLPARRMPIGSLKLFRLPRLSLRTRHCSFCRTGTLTDGTITFVGVTACPSCLQDNSTAEFRTLLETESAVYQMKFAGGRQ